MKTTRIMTLALLIVGSGLALYVAQAQQVGADGPNCRGTT